MQETWVWSLGWEGPLEKEMATHSSILAWEIPWTEKSGWLQPMGSKRVGYDWCDLACIHAQFIIFFFTINAKIHMRFFFFKADYKCFFQNICYLWKIAFPLCLYVCICMFRQKPRVYIKDIIISWIFLFIPTFENCSYIFSRSLDFSKMNK